MTMMLTNHRRKARMILKLQCGENDSIGEKGKSVVSRDKDLLNQRNRVIRDRSAVTRIQKTLTNLGKKRNLYEKEHQQLILTNT